MITHKEQTAKIIHENIKTKGLQLSIVQKKKRTRDFNKYFFEDIQMAKKSHEKMLNITNP